MLTVYTPEPASADLSEIVTHMINLCRKWRTLATCRSDTGVALKTSWCREMVTVNLKEAFTDAPPGILNIYGIRKHGTNLEYQPCYCPGEIKQTVQYTENLLGAFSTMMVEMISCVLDNNAMSPDRVREWIRRWGTIGFNRSYVVGGDPVGPNVNFLLNSDPNDIPELRVDNKRVYWADGDMYGTITGVPAHWATSIPVMSYLLYIPRVWGGFYSSPRVLRKLSQISRRKRIYSPILKSIIGPAGPYGAPMYHTRLWASMAYKMMLPLWCTPYGKEYFWTFTYLLIRAALGNTSNHEDDMSELASNLYSQKDVYGSGFVSWLGRYKSKEGAPGWVRGLLSELSISGPSSLIRFDSVAKYL